MLAAHNAGYGDRLLSVCDYQHFGSQLYRLCHFVEQL